MGGKRLGAGRSGWRQKCEDFLPLDIRKLRAHGRLRAGTRFRWGWRRPDEDEQLGEVRVGADPRGLALTYHSEHGDTEHRVEFTWTPCRFGGQRTWFVCPCCGRRCAVLYGVDHRGRFSCRLCMNLAYSSETEDTTGRLWRKQLKLEAKLSEHGAKPKWTRWRTYMRICTRIDAIEEARAVAFFGA